MSLRILSIAAIVVVVVAATAHAGPINVRGVGSEANFALGSGTFMELARTALQNPANFGAGGGVSDSVTILPDIVGPITAADLVGVDVLIASAINTSYSAASANAVLAFVQGGGSLVFYGDVGVNFGAASNTMASVFGITYGTDDFLDGPATVTNEPTHPIMSGPFGASVLALDFSGSIVSASNALTVATISGGPSDGRGAIVVQDATTGFAGSGRAVWFTDVNILASNFGLYPANETLFLNTIAFASADPIPEPGTLVMFGVAAAGLVAIRIRRRRARKA